MRLNADNITIIGSIAIVTCPDRRIVEVAVITPEGISVVTPSDRDRIDRCAPRRARLAAGGAR